MMSLPLLSSPRAWLASQIEKARELGAITIRDLHGKKWALKNIDMAKYFETSLSRVSREGYMEGVEDMIEEECGPVDIKDLLVIEWTTVYMIYWKVLQSMIVLRDLPKDKRPILPHLAAFPRPIAGTPSNIQTEQIPVINQDKKEPQQPTTPDTNTSNNKIKFAIIPPPITAKRPGVFTQSGPPKKQKRTVTNSPMTSQASSSQTSTSKPTTPQTSIPQTRSQVSTPKLITSQASTSRVPASTTAAPQKSIQTSSRKVSQVTAQASPQRANTKINAEENSRLSQYKQIQPPPSINLTARISTASSVPRQLHAGAQDLQSGPRSSAVLNPARPARERNCFKDPLEAFGIRRGFTK
ncbi:hypothetical protein B0O99DRAFT_611406 [Bisporella sp. PMI_857]|nr:hypothetical protein B0O99DRAFT_611406 [Bisporella sp. PMI_857]